MNVRDNLLSITRKLPQGVTLVAVSKFKSAELIQEAYAAGQRDFGENYVQELVDKHEQLPKDIRWHFIGHLQSNKVKYLAPFVHLIHGIDSLKLLEEVNKQATKQGRVVECLLQIFIAREESKFGLDFDEAESIIASDKFEAMKNVKVSGVMGMATNTEDMATVKREFLSLSAFASRLGTSYPGKPNFEMKHISMGMSGDYELAIECGSNMVRIGSSIFGQR
jgi:pyridoxal phosphate enzyme (YggS family)